jgi:hypothetical protein
MEDVVPTHAFVTSDNVGGSVAFGMANVKTSTTAEKEREGENR